jgi:hypothetical protein
MAVSRYRNTKVIDEGKTYETISFPSREELDKISVIRIRVANFDRLDILASKYLGSGEYWWVIALINDFEWAFSFEEGQVLKIPVDVQDVLRLF